MSKKMLPPAFLAEDVTLAEVLAEDVESALADLTLIGPAAGAELRAMVYGS